MAGLTQPEMARRVGWVQPKVSRLETGVQDPTEDDIRTWAAHTYLSAEQTEDVLDMLSATNIDYKPTVDLLRRGELARRQAHIGAMEAAATRIGEYQPAFLPGLLHTADYARALLELPGSARSKGASDSEIEAIIAGRLKRQERMLEPGRRWQFVIGEAALWSPPDGLEVQVSQLDHLVTVCEILDVELGVIPLRAPMPVMPVTGFRVLDDELVFVESLDGEDVVSDSVRVAPLLQAFETLRAASVTGSEAVVLIQCVPAELRG